MLQWSEPVKLSLCAITADDMLDSPILLLAVPSCDQHQPQHMHRQVVQAQVMSLSSRAWLKQGHGNNCTNAEDFTNWRLDVTGAKADYAFFGKMKAAAATK